MIQPQTYLNVADNSGARKLMCIRVIGTSNRKYANIGDIIIAVVKEAVPNMPIKKSEIIRAVVVRTKKEFKRNNGSMIMQQLSLIKKETQRERGFLVQLLGN